MEGEQIPKATMNNFLKSKLKVGFSSDFSNRMLQLAKDFIYRLTQQANEVCTKNDKKTINAEHVESALVNFGLQIQLPELKQMSSSIKQQNQIKQQFRQRIQSNIQKNLQQISGQQLEPRVVSIKQNIEIIQVDNNQGSQEIDYQAQIEEDASQKSPNSSSEQVEEKRQSRNKQKKL